MILAYFIVLDSGVDSSETRFERRKLIGRHFRDVQQRLDNVDESFFFFGCKSLDGSQKCRKKSGNLTGARHGRN